MRFACVPEEMVSVAVLVSLDFPVNKKVEVNSQLFFGTLPHYTLDQSDGIFLEFVVLCCSLMSLLLTLQN